MKNKVTQASLLILFVLLHSSSLSQVENDIKLIYTESESGDTYSSVTKIILYFDGRIEKYSNKSGLGEILTSVRSLSQNEINFIDRIFSKYNFSSYPDMIPLVKTPMWPSSSKGVKYKNCQECEMKTFAYSSNSEHKYLPDNYVEFIKELKARLFSFF